ncbi:MAG: hypothetical protein COS99_01515 [Candidatus Omnitrophica bacterium CG07_land_8_20_14_0_80_42_15]|uniref:Polysaccharide chain length determinant N-terminal domain-containing protein n=1 Tax=Candidatus Aquitaenariimonas noxiae TaxID=1974741 RepID=A0A2J0KUP3_9BACT|nr:MAG: hypothetical protein COS99_01515 [Candidatus Omnitrophica bacterium CG07_land_8_20_14_0_80_42_15]
MAQREKEITLRDYIDVIIKRKGIIFISVLVVTISGFVFSPPKTLVYKATSYIAVEGSSYSANLVEFLKRFIKSNTLSEEVIRSMEFEKAETLKVGGELADQSVFNITIGELVACVSVESDESSTDLGISVLADNPKKAMYLSNSIAKVVVDQSFKGITGGTQASLDYVERQLRTLEQKINEGKQAIARYAPLPEAKGSAFPEEEREMEKLQQDYINAKLERQMAEAQLKVLEEKLGSSKKDDLMFPIMSKSGNLLTLKDKLAELERGKATLLTQFTEEHPNVIELQTKIDDAKDAINKETRKPLEELKTQILEARNKEETIKSVLELRFPDVPSEKEGVSSEVTGLRRELKLQEKTYERLLEEKEKLRVDILLDATRVRLFRQATEPKKPEKPKGPPAAFITITLGLILGLTGAFMQENMDTSLKTIEEVEYYVNYPIIGVIPMIKTGKKIKK